MSDSVYDAFHASAQRFGNHPALLIPHIACSAYSAGDIEWSYSELLAAADTLSAVYEKNGYGIGHRVALALENRADFFLHWLALNRIGASVVPLNLDQQPEEMRWVLQHSGASVVICLSEHWRSLHDVTQAAGLAVALADTALTGLSKVVSTLPASTITAETECALLYTSGSTGRPKGCVLSNAYFTLMGEWYRDIGGLCALREGSERLVTPLPLTHMNAMATSAMGMFMSGGCLIQLDRFHPRSWWQTVRDAQASVIHYLGVMPAILLGIEEDAGDFSSQVRFGFGAGVNPKHHAPFEARFGFPLIEAWAMTETGSAGCIVANQEPRHVGSSCFGKPPASMEWRLVDAQDQDVPQGQPGELLVRSKGMNPRRGFFSGYWQDTAATEAAWAGGWWHTGDVVREGSDGSLHFVDRRKNVIRRSGENIAALEVEAALVLDGRIAEVVVTAAPDELRGDEVLAAVVLKPGIAPSASLAQNIARQSAESLSYFKVPGYIVFVDEIPRTASQKPQRGAIKQRVEHWLVSPQCYDLRADKKRQSHA